MADVFAAPLAGQSYAYAQLATSATIELVLLSGRSVTPAPSVGTYSAIEADVMPGVSPVTVVNWTAPINAGGGSVGPRFATTTVPAVPSGSSITGVVVRAGGFLLYHVLFDVANEVETTGGDMLFSCGSDGLYTITPIIP
jgi:hypothetical protein